MIKFIIGSMLIPWISIAAVQSIQLGSQDDIPKTRWIYNKKANDLKPNFKKLAELKNAQVQKNYDLCKKLGVSLYAANTSLRPWILLIRYDCEQNLVQQKRETVAGLVNLNKLLKAQQPWLLTGPYRDDLRTAYVTAEFLILEGEMKKQPQAAWVTAGNLMDLQDWMTKPQKAKIFQMAGELAFLQQDLTVAKSYILKSLATVEDSKLRDKLNAIESAMQGKTTAVKTMLDASHTADTSEAAETQNQALLGVEEQKIVDRMTEALKTGNLFSAAQDGMNLIQNYPGSVQADWAAQRIGESYLSILTLDAKKYQSLRYDFLQLMKKADSKRLTDWSKKVFRIGQFGDAAELAESAYLKCKDNYCPAEVVLLTANSFLQSHDLDKSEKYYKSLIENYSGTQESIDSLFNLGMIQYIKKDYGKALLQFEKVVSQIQFPNYELNARYWLWRTAQRVDKDRAQSELQTLVQKFPFSYYGLRAISDANGGKISFKNFDKKIKIKHRVWLSPQEKQAWDRFFILSGAGWYDEANKELDQLPTPQSPEGLALMARLYAAAFNYQKAIRMLNEAWDQNPDIRSMEFITTAFPKEFYNYVEAQSKVRSLDSRLVMGLIRQESAFNRTAISSSGALGLMQMIPPTAKEVAQTLKIKNLVIPDQLFEPETNIKMGSYYLAKLVSDFNNNIPLALAAYNAGPTNIKRWMQSFQLTPQSSSSPEYEVWIDLMPWNETKFYVKAILRNFLIYQLIESDQIQVQDPVWASTQG